jgi:MFS transporter, DHA3 family, tetracycline resistance protein
MSVQQQPYDAGGHDASRTTFPLFRSLSYRPFALLWSGQTISRIGDFLYQVALAWWVLEQTGSAMAMGTMLICAFASMLLFLVIGGVTVDRLPRVRVMLVADLIRCALISSVAVLAFGQSLQIWHVLVASLLVGFVDAFFQPAYTALVPELIPQEQLQSANALTSMSQHLGRVTGPMLGAAIIALIGTGGAFAIDGLSFLISAACLLPLLRNATWPAGGSGHEVMSVVCDVREGIATVLRSPVLWISIAVFALSNITLAGPYSVALPFLVKDHLQGDVDTLGLLYAIFPLGYLGSGAVLGSLPSLRRRGIVAFGGLILAGLMLAAFGLPLPLAGLVLAAFIKRCSTRNPRADLDEYPAGDRPERAVRARREHRLTGLIRLAADRLRAHGLGNRRSWRASGVHARRYADSRFCRAGAPAPGDPALTVIRIWAGGHRGCWQGADEADGRGGKWGG